MHQRTLWVLDDDDRDVVDALSVGLGRTAAWVLAYLQLRADREDDPATAVEIQIGTELSRTPISDAVSELEEDGLVERSTLSDDSRGRPPSAWRPTAALAESRRRVYERHARDLLERAEALFTDRSAEPETGSEAGLTVALNWRPNGLHVPVYAASEAGWYDEYDVDVDLEHHEGSARAIDRVHRGEADIAVAGAATVLRARTSGVSVVPVAILYQRAMTVLYTVRDVFGAELRSVSQLQGRRIGMAPRSEMGVLGRLFVSQTALEDDIELVETTGEEREALATGDADVVVGSMTDPRQLERRGESVDALRVTDHFPIYGPTIVVRERLLRTRRSALTAFLAATAGGLADATGDPGPAVERIAAIGDDDPDHVRETFERAVTEFGDSEATREHGWGWQRERTWDRLRTALDQGGLLTEP